MGTLAYRNIALTRVPDADVVSTTDLIKSDVAELVNFMSGLLIGNNGMGASHICLIHNGKNWRWELSNSVPDDFIEF